MRSKLALIVLTLIVGSAGSARGEVNIKNGNFFIAYKDVIYSGGFEPTIERVYNSKTPFKSIFGWGWGTEYSAYLTVSPDGTVVIHEYGGGADNRYSPNAINSESVKTAAETIIRAARESGAVINAGDVDNLRRRLLEDSEFRDREWEKYVEHGLVARRDIPVGTLLISNRFNHQTVRRVAEGFIRTMEGGRVESFDRQGRLLRLTDGNQNFIELAYDTRGKLRTITDNFGRTMILTVNNRGLLEKVEGSGGKTTAYKYNDKDQLVYASDTDGNEYTYSYDGHHNLMTIGYTDGTLMEMAYHTRDLFENLRSVKDRDGTLTTYGYTWSPTDKNDYTVHVNVTEPGGHAVSKNTYRYLIAHEENGDEWTRKLITDFDGVLTETLYNITGRPVEIIHRGARTRFQYDEQGHLIRKETPADLIEQRYHPIFGKVTWTRRALKDAPPTWSKFDYDERGNLSHAQNSAGKSVTLEYDANGRIFALTDERHLRVEFEYNANSKPIEIRTVANGEVQKLTVEYDDQGNIEKVDSHGGTRIAKTITEAFQTMLDIVRPAGVSLSF
jgi:YD repeat-containing protein